MTAKVAKHKPALEFDIRVQSEQCVRGVSLLSGLINQGACSSYKLALRVVNDTKLTCVQLETLEHKWHMVSVHRISK